MPNYPLSVILTLIDRFSQPLGGAGGALERFGKQASKAGRELSTKVTLPLVAFGAVAAKTGLEYQRGLNRVAVITGATAKEVAALESQTAQTLGAQGIPVMASESAEAMGALAQSMQNLEDVGGALPHALVLASATGKEAGETAEALASTLDAYALSAADAGRATDILAFGAAHGQQSFEDFVSGLTRAGAVGRSFGQDIEGMAGLLDTLAQAGIGGAQGAALLEKGIAKLARPTTETGKVLKRLGIDAEDIFTDGGVLRPFDEVLVTLTEHGAEARDTLALFGLEGGRLAPLLGEGAARSHELAQGFRDAKGAASEMAKVALGEGVGSLERFHAQWERLLITVAQSGLIEGLGFIAEKVGSLLTKVSQANPALLRFGLVFGGILAAAGPLLAAVGALIAFVSPLGIAFTVAAAAGAAIVASWDDIKAAASRVWGYVKSVIPDWILDLLSSDDQAGGAPAPRRPVAIQRDISPERIEAFRASRAAGATVGGKIQVEFENAPAGTTVRAQNQGDVGLNVDVGYNLAAGLAG